MQSQEIPREQWASFLKDFSRLHLGQRAKLWVAGPSTGLLKEATDLPLVGVDTDRTASQCERIDVIVGDSPDAHVMHEVRRPKCVRIARNDGGADLSLQIDSEDGSSTFLSLAQPAAATTPTAFA